VAEVLVFDLYGTLVDPLAIAADLTELLDTGGSEVSRLWRAKQLEYSFRLTVMDSYRDFRAVTRSCGRSRRLRLSSAKPGNAATPTTWSQQRLGELAVASHLRRELRGPGVSRRSRR
jgi:HAD superfamily hydrolase (TIGR01493 family)